MVTRRALLSIGASAAVGAGLGGYAFVIEPRFRLVEVHHEVKAQAWGARAPLKIVALSDFHFCNPWMPISRIEKIVSKVNALNPDLIFLLGDFAPGLEAFRTSHVKIEDWVVELKNLKARLGVHAVLGNHDWWSGGNDYANGIKQTGATLYQNNAIKIINGRDQFWISGNDSILAEPKPNGGFKDRSYLGHIYEQINDDNPVIHLMHEPDIFPQLHKPIFLGFAGHTHGGQVRLPFLGRRVVPSRFGEKYAYGHIVENDTHLIVSAGLGVSIAPVRFTVPPEITIVTLSGVI